MQVNHAVLCPGSSIQRCHSTIVEYSGAYLFSVSLVRISILCTNLVAYARVSVTSDDISKVSTIEIPDTSRAYTESHTVRIFGRLHVVRRLHLSRPVRDDKLPLLLHCRLSLTALLTLCSLRLSSCSSPRAFLCSLRVSLCFPRIFCRSASGPRVVVVAIPAVSTVRIGIGRRRGRRIGVFGGSIPVKQRDFDAAWMEEILVITVSAWRTVMNMGHT